MEGKECHCVFSGDAPLLACLLFCSQLRPFLDPPLLTERCRPTTWHGQWLQTNSNRRMQITVAGELTVMEVDVKGRALFFKTIAAQEKEYRSDFRRVRDDFDACRSRGHVDKASYC